MQNIRPLWKIASNTFHLRKCSATFSEHYATVPQDWLGIANDVGSLEDSLIAGHTVQYVWL